MTCAYIAFTARGLALAQQLAAACPGSVTRGGADGVRLTDWTAAVSYTHLTLPTNSIV